MGSAPPGPDDATATVDVERPTEETVSVPVAANARRRRGTLAAGHRVHRYEIVRALGSGGMGVVYEARDVELGRRVALKMQRHGLPKAQTASARLWREAQALAQLSHPNVVAVHDVGVHHDDVFIAMELADGDTVDSWLRAGSRSIAEILRVFVAAGRGLEAAHASGLVHRDVKPSNVLIGRDGRIRVIDFGLARAPVGERASNPSVEGATSTTSGSTDDTESSDRSEDRLHSPLTKVGSIVGTPAYMSPEQHRGQALDHRSDQFSFAVALYEAIYGARPYRGRELAAKDATPALAFPDRPRVPARVRRALERALSIDPARRFPSMTPLLAALEGSSRSRLGWLAGGAVVAAASALLAVQSLRPDVEPCARAAARLDGVWDATMKSRVRAALTSNAAPYAASTLARVSSIVEDYTTRWLDKHQQACRATRVVGSQSAQMLDMRMACLDRRLAEVRALTMSLTGSIDVATVERAARAATQLSDLATCEAAQLVSARYALPAEPQRRALIAMGWQRVGALQMQSRLGQYEAGRAAALALVRDARRLDYPPLTAASLLQLGSFEQAFGESPTAEATFAEAIQIAAAAADDEVVADAWIQSLWATHAQARTKDAILNLPAATAAVRRAGDPPRLRAELASIKATLSFTEGRYQDAVETYRTAVPLYIEARGADHTEVALARTNLATALATIGAYDEALAEARQALAITQRLHGNDHPDTASAHYVIGFVSSKRGDLDAALEAYVAALKIRDRALAPNAPLVAQTAQAIGSVLGRLGRGAEARTYLERALTIVEQTQGPKHPTLAYALHNIGSTFDPDREHERAIAYHERALAVREAAHGEHPLVADSLALVARTCMAARKQACALRAVERAVRIGDRTTLPPPQRAALDWLAAQVYWEDPAQRGRAVRHARAALQLYRTLNDTAPSEVIEGWLAARD